MLRMILIFIASLILQITASCTLDGLQAQSVTGSWYGKADVMLSGNNSNYLTELSLKQKGNEVEGIFAYYFKDSYQSFFVRGAYDPKTRQVDIRNLPMLFYGADTRNGIECPMNFQGTFMVSKVNSTIRGSFYTVPKYKYTCPELRVTLLMDSSEKIQDSLLKNVSAGKKFWHPREQDFVVNQSARKDSTPESIPAPPVNIISDTVVVKKDTTAIALKTDTADIVTKKDTAIVAAIARRSTPAVPFSKKPDTVAPVIAMGSAMNMAPVFSASTAKEMEDKFSSRKNIYGRDIIVASDSILVQFYDNGDVDGDSISVFINGKPVIINQLLSSRALNVFVALDTLSEISELSMFAVNLGKYPPNTALMVITDGVYKREVYLSSSLTQNASVRLRRFRKSKP